MCGRMARIFALATVMSLVVDAGAAVLRWNGSGYGLAWEEFIEITATPELIANELRRQGIWCWQDIRNDALTSANRAFDQGDFLRRVDKEVKQ